MEVIYIHDISTDENIKHLDAVMNLTREVFGKENDSIGMRCSHILLHEVHRKDAKEVFLILEENRIIGFLLFSTLIEFTGYIHWMAIEENHRNKGLGTMLLDTLETKAKTEKISNILLITQDTGFYEKSGYEKVKETHRDKIICDIERSEWLMIKNIYN